MKCGPQKGPITSRVPTVRYINKVKITSFFSILFAQVVLMGPLRLVLAFYLYQYDRVVVRGMEKREANKKMK